MPFEFGTSMTRRRLNAADAADDARILEVRKARRAQLLEKARRNPQPPSFVVTWFRGRRTIGTL